VNSAVSLKRTAKADKEEVEPCDYGRRPRKMERTWRAPLKNPPVYGKRHVFIVWFGTGETFLCTAAAVK